MADDDFLTELLKAGDPPPDMPHDELISLYQEGKGWTGDDMAYDGSSAPPVRGLTARERDVICGVISDIIGHVRRTGNMDAVPLRGGQDWLNHLVVIRQVIDPRRDDDDEPC